MDLKLVAWARAVKARATRRGRDPTPLWLFSDAERMPDIEGAVSRLPRGLCGVVFRHDRHPDRVAIAGRVARICRARRLTLVIAGDWRLAAQLRTGLHVRGGRGPARPLIKLITASAHDRVSLRRARRSKATTIFLSPAFPTLSHPGGVAWGPVRWSALSIGAGETGTRVAALGGVTGSTARRLPFNVAGAGGIGALV